MADNEPAAKRLKRDKFVFDSSSEDDDDNTVIRSIEMDVSNDICTSDDSENDWLSQSSNRGEQLKHKPLLLKVPRGKLMVPESVKNPGTASVSDTRKSVITPEQFDALNVMPLEHICIFAEASKAFKEIALKFFPMKYRNMNLAQLINPETRKLCSLSCQCQFFFRSPELNRDSFKIGR